MLASVPKSSGSPNGYRRLFFALKPPPELIDVLLKAQQQWLNALGDKAATVRPLPAENFHLTLKFLGPISQAEQAQWQARAASIEAAPFTLTLNQSGYFAKARTGWLGVNNSAPLAQLAAQLSAPPDWLAHISLLRRLNCIELPALTLPNCQWQVSEFYLYQSSGGTLYQQLAQFGLREKIG